MDVFISWAGKRSGAMAEAFRWFLPKIINSANPWASRASIESGRLWRSELGGILQSARFGIFCLTPASLSSNWLFFEAGAISKTLEDAYVCPVLLGLRQSDVPSPLSDFQCRDANRDGILALTRTLNEACGEEGIGEQQLLEMFDILWPKLEEKLLQLPSDDQPGRPERDLRDIVEEVLGIVRGFGSAFQYPSLGPATVGSLYPVELKIDQPDGQTEVHVLAQLKQVVAKVATRFLGRPLSINVSRHLDPAGRNLVMVTIGQTHRTKSFVVAVPEQVIEFERILESTILRAFELIPPTDTSQNTPS